MPLYDKSAESVVLTLEKDLTLKEWKGCKFDVPYIIFHGGVGKIAEQLDSIYQRDKHLKDDGYHCYIHGSLDLCSETALVSQIYWTTDIHPAGNQGPDGKAIIAGLKEVFLDWIQEMDRERAMFEAFGKGQQEPGV